MKLKDRVRFKQWTDALGSKYVTVNFGRVRCPKCHREGSLEAMINISVDLGIVMDIAIYHRNIKRYAERDLVKICFFKVNEPIKNPASYFAIVPEIAESTIGA